MVLLNPVRSIMQDAMSDALHTSWSLLMSRTRSMATAWQSPRR
jgi:hypothetical protein